MMLSSRDVEIVKTRQQLWRRKEKPRREDERIAWPERQTMLGTRIIHSHRVFLCVTFQSMSRLWRLWRLRTHTTGQIRGIWPIHSAKKNGYFKSLFPYWTRLFHNLFGWHFASEEWWASYCYLFHALEMYTVLSCLGNAVLSFSLQPFSMVPRIT